MYYVVNGTAYDYYQQRTSSNSFTNTTHHNAYYYNYYYDSYINNVVSSGSVRQIAYMEKGIINIPPHTGKSISEYNIIRELYRDCDLFLYPGRKEIKSANFNQNNTPLKFYNYLTYIFNTHVQNEKVVKNEFWVSQITNYPKDKIVESKNHEFCEQKSMARYDHFTVNRKNRFYYKYIREQNAMFIH